MEVVDGIDAFVGRHLRAHTKERDRLIEQLQPTDSRGRKRGITTAKRMIRSLGYEIHESNDRGRPARYFVIRHTPETARRMRQRLNSPHPQTEE